MTTARNRYNKRISLALRTALVLSAGVVIFSLAFAIFFVLIRGLPHISSELFATDYSRKNQSVLPALWNTAQIVLLALFFAVPTATGAALFCCEYTTRRWCGVLCAVSDTIASLPSVVFGLFGMTLFCVTCGLGYSLMSGALTVSLMLFPIIFDSVKRGIESLPSEQRAGALALGSGKTALIIRIVVPHCARYLVSGCSLAVSRVLAESAALLFTSGTAPGYAAPDAAGRTLAVHIYCLAAEGASIDKAYACAALLLILSGGFSLAARLIKSGTVRNRQKE